jgi:hypothetical protein
MPEPSACGPHLLPLLEEPGDDLLDLGVALWRTARGQIGVGIGEAGRVDEAAIEG